MISEIVIIRVLIKASRRCRLFFGNALFVNTLVILIMRLGHVVQRILNVVLILRNFAECVLDTQDF